MKATGAELLHVDDEVLAAIATTVTPQGVVGVAVLPPAPLAEVIDGASLLVVLSDVADPGNAGTVVRTADAVGADGVVLAGASADPRNPKAVRASTGSLFHLPVVDRVPLDAVVGACRDAGIRLVAAAADGDAVYSQIDLTAPTALLFGSEAHGLPGTAVAQCDAAVRVPMWQEPRAGFAGVAESLNLAATVAVVCFEAARQRRETKGAPPRLGQKR